MDASYFKNELATDRLLARLNYRGDLSQSIIREHARSVAQSTVADPDDQGQLEAAAFVAVRDFPRIFQVNTGFRPTEQSAPMTASERETQLKGLLTGLV